MPFFPNSLSCPKKLSSGYQLYAPQGHLLRGACGNFLSYASILEKIAILGQPPSPDFSSGSNRYRGSRFKMSERRA